MMAALNLLALACIVYLLARLGRWIWRHRIGVGVFLLASSAGDIALLAVALLSTPAYG